MRWSNESVKMFAPHSDPIYMMEDRARDLILWAMDKGWSGPPFDPLKLADLLKIPVSPSAEIRDARTVPVGKRGVRIEFNPTRPRGRVRFSIAHEIVHTFFPDCAETVRHRHDRHVSESDTWQLEMLCNIGAAELVMPIGSLSKEVNPETSIKDVLFLRKKYDVSTEALLIRVAKVINLEWAAFCASRCDGKTRDAAYNVDYVIPSPRWSGTVKAGDTILPASVVSECTAIGYTAQGIEHWGSPHTRVSVECVGLPAYPGAAYPRVAGLLKRTSRTRRTQPQITYVHGDALSPRGRGHQIIAHVVNDRTPNWGGGGFAGAVRRRWSHVQDVFRNWTGGERGRLAIGNWVSVPAVKDIEIFCMIAQKGYGPSSTPRIRYVGLEKCLHALAERASSCGAKVHMPRIGTGHAGGEWSVIEELIVQELVGKGISVTIYDLPDKKSLASTDSFLSEFS